jgi:hypothetical protein
MLTRQDLFSLEEYAEKRSAIRSDTIQIKKLREVNLGEHVRMLFENKKTVQFQIQEMLRIEKIFEADGIQEELDVYNSLVPEGSNLKATMMIEYTNVEERTVALSKLIGVERSIYFQVGNHDKVFAICNEDMDKEFSSGVPVKVGVSHPHYDYEIILNSESQDALSQDFNNN